MKLLVSSFLLLTALCYLSCNTATQNDVPKEALETPFTLKTNNFYTDLFALNGDTSAAKRLQLAANYPDFFYLFTKRIINIGDSLNPQMPSILQNFLQDPYINQMYAEVNKQFTDLTPYNQQFTEAFKRYHYLFPSKTIPEVTWFVSGYNYAHVTTVTTLAIGLEMYLGNTYEPYTLLEIPNYKKQLMQKEYIVSDAMQVWLSTDFENEKDNATLLHQMIFKGKIMYALQKIMPNTPDTISFGYSVAQLKWCAKNETKIWAHFIEKKILFSPLRGDNLKYVNEGPFTAGFPRESPGKIGVWIGYQIVANYMKNKPETSLQELFENHNAQEILTQSKYKPK